VRRALLAGALLAVPAGLAVRAYRRDDVAARVRLASPAVPVHRVALSRGALEYARYGEGPTVVVLHGSGGGWDQGVDWARRRLAGGSDVVAVSRPGYLGSDLPADTTTAAAADMVAELLTSLGVGRADVVGLSAGAPTALHLAARHPPLVRSVLLESPLLPTARPVPLPPLPAVRLLTRLPGLLWLLLRSPLLVGLSAGVPRRELGTAERAELAAITATTFPVGPRAAGTVVDRAVTGEEVRRGEVPAEEVRAPTLVVNAAGAVLAPHADAEAFVARLPDGRLVEPTSGGHVLVGNVEPLRAVVSGFLREAREREGPSLPG
jgi:pimeloyl-ACP methyl ester carboxylesterase